MSNAIPLPPPQLDLDYPLMQALAQRKSTRRWLDTPISQQDLANLLWAACGQTKAAKGKAKSKRTTPSACNSQEIRAYVLLPQGTYLYNEIDHCLTVVNDKDLRNYVGTQKMMHKAPLGLVFVADLSRMKAATLKSKEAKEFTAWVDTGYISQNVYLYCATAGLGTVALAWVNRDVLSNHMGLATHEKIVLTQVVGYKEEKPTPKN